MHLTLVSVNLLMSQDVKYNFIDIVIDYIIIRRGLNTSCCLGCHVFIAKYWAKKLTLCKFVHECETIFMSTFSLNIAMLVFMLSCYKTSWTVILSNFACMVFILFWTNPNAYSVHIRYETLNQIIQIFSSIYDLKMK